MLTRVKEAYKFFILLLLATYTINLQCWREYASFDLNLGNNKTVWQVSKEDTYNIIILVNGEKSFKKFQLRCKLKCFVTGIIQIIKIYL